MPEFVENFYLSDEVEFVVASVFDGEEMFVFGGGIAEKFFPLGKWDDTVGRAMDDEERRGDLSEVFSVREAVARKKRNARHGAECGIKWGEKDDGAVGISGG